MSLPQAALTCFHHSGFHHQPVLVRLALNRVIRDLDVGLVGGLVLVQVSLAGDVKTMPGEEFVQLLASVALVISSLVARINHGQYR
jgi:hypothetical protein